MMTNEGGTFQNFWTIGINYKKTTTVERGLFAVGPDQYERILTRAKALGIAELFIISTCNRTEVYAFAPSPEAILTILAAETAGDLDLLRRSAYVDGGEDAVQHLFQVAAGLDSQILGDFEILGQIKNAVKFAHDRGFVGSTLERIVNTVYRSAKAVKTHTALSCGTVSVSFAAVQYIKDHFHDAAGKKIVLVGTGKIGRATCKNLIDYLGAANITLINRTDETAAELAGALNVQSAPYAQLHREVAAADIVLVSTGAMEPVILRRHLSGQKPQIVIDLSVPCNVEKTVQDLPGLTLVDVDALSKIKDETLEKRKAEVPKAHKLIHEHIAELTEWHNMRRFVPLIHEMKGRLEGIRVPASLCNLNVEPADEEREAYLKKAVNAFAAKIRKHNAAGCSCIEAINDYISYHE